MPKLSVVIPFYQQKQGILRNAVVSALKQKTNVTVEIVIVDDGSPVRARSDLADLFPQHRDSIRIIEQKNTGVGAARNTALDYLGDDVDIVAFLDSDDVWDDDHLKHAVWALENGYEFYFSDFYQLNQSVSAFNRAGRIKIEDHSRIHTSYPIYSYAGDMVNQIITGNIIGTSTVAYNFKNYRTVRFPVDFRHAGEDYIFWMRLTTQTKRLAFCSEAECRYGSGVNIFSESGWGTDKYLRVLHDDIKYRKHILDNFALTQSQQEFLNKRIGELRASYGKGFLHNLLHNHRVNQSLIWNQLKLDPLTFVSMAASPAAAVYGKLRKS